MQTRAVRTAQGIAIRAAMTGPEHEIRGKGNQEHNRYEYDGCYRHNCKQDEMGPGGASFHPNQKNSDAAGCSL
jgi:hypothetical protein